MRLINWFLGIDAKAKGEGGTNQSYQDLNYKAKLKTTIKLNNDEEFYKLILPAFKSLGWGYESYSGGMNFSYGASEPVQELYNYIRQGNEQAIDTFIDIRKSVKELSHNFKDEISIDLTNIYLPQVNSTVKIINMLSTIAEKQAAKEKKERETLLSAAISSSVEFNDKANLLRIKELQVKLDTFDK